MGLARSSGSFAMSCVAGKVASCEVVVATGNRDQAEMVCHNGALCKARKDTAQAPGGADWVCVARHGRDAITPIVRGNYDVHESYAELDIVSFDGCAYNARSDDPGLCPAMAGTFEQARASKAAAARPSEARKARKVKRR